MVATSLSVHGAKDLLEISDSGIAFCRLFLMHSLQTKAAMYGNTGRYSLTDCLQLQHLTKLSGCVPEPMRVGGGPDVPAPLVSSCVFASSSGIEFWSWVALLCIMPDWRQNWEISV